MSFGTQSTNAMSASGGFRGLEGLPDPFCDVSALTMPSTMIDALRWCERVFERMGVYRAGIERIIAYFITEVSVEGDDRKEKVKYEEYLYDELNIKSVLLDAALDYFFYGNYFGSALIPIKRYLACPKCGLERPLKTIWEQKTVFQYKWADFEFNIHCPRCHRQGAWTPRDRRSSEGQGLIIKRWNPYEMEIIFDYLTEKCSYVWKIPSDYRDQIRRGDMCCLETANWEIIQAVKHNQWLRFEDDFVYHMKEHRLAGQVNRGWGISKVLTNFGIAYYVQMLHKYNEALALDYVVPFRVLTPELQGGPIDQEPAYKLGMSTFVSRVNSMVKARGKDPTRWNVLPFPVKYQALGGDATAFTPKDLLDQGYDVLFNSIGCPIELYKGTLTAQGAIPALRIFESHHTHFRDQLLDLLKFIVKAVSARKQWQPVVATLDKPTHADDITRQQTQLQLGLNQQISQTTALRPLGINWEEEQRKKLEEQRFTAEITAKAQKEMDQESASDQVQPGIGATTLLQQPPGQPGQPGAAPPGGAPPGGAQPAAGAGVPSTNLGNPKTPEEYMATAQSMAQSLLTMDETSRKRQLANIKGQDPVLQRVVIEALDKIRDDARAQGGAQVMAQQGMGGGAPQQ